MARRSSFFGVEVLIENLGGRYEAVAREPWSWIGANTAARARARRSDRVYQRRPRDHHRDGRGAKLNQLRPGGARRGTHATRRARALQ